MAQDGHLALPSILHRSFSDLDIYQHSLKTGCEQWWQRGGSLRLRKKPKQTDTTWPPAEKQSLVARLLADHMYQVSLPVIQPVAPLLIEPHSSSSEEDVPSPVLVTTTDRHLLFIGSSSDVNAKSAPTSPQDVDLECKPESRTGAVTPRHTFNRSDRHAIKQLSTSSPAMTHAHSVVRGPTDADGSDGAPLTAKTPQTELIATPGSSKARQKKFHRLFKQVAVEERVLNYYSCALVGDILLQGHLYITSNYFAFYSNVFGYITRLLIPTVEVLKVSKEKTARIIPNAVGISIRDEKHVFGSLLSRDSTYKLMVQVWKAARSPDPVVEMVAPKVKDVEDSASGELLLDDESSASGSGNEDPSAPCTPLPTSESLQKLVPKSAKSTLKAIPAISAKTAAKKGWSPGQPSVILAISTALLFALFLSAGFLLYRIAKIQDHFRGFPLVPQGEDIYQDILKWQSALHSRSASEVHEFLNANLNQIAKVRLSLEALSMLILAGRDKGTSGGGREEGKSEEGCSLPNS